MLRLARESNADVRLVIYPYHLLLMLQIDEAGLWPLLERWKMDLTTIAEEARREGTRVAVWDFACPDDLTAEPIPADGDRRTSMRWYWEAGHFKKELGDRVLSKVLGDSGLDASMDFGVELDSENVGDRIQSCRRRLQEMRTRHPDMARVAASLHRATQP